MKSFRTEQTFNGTWGEAWVDGDYLAEITAGKAEVTLKYSAISQVQKLQDGQKLTGLEMKGEIKMHKVSSYMTKKLSEKIKKGKTWSATIILKIDDPDAIGAERVALYNCKFDKMILADWEAGKNSEESYGFTFEDYELLDVTR